MIHSLLFGKFVHYSIHKLVSKIFQENRFQGLQISLMSRVSLTSASQILESFWNIWSQVSDFPVHGPGMYTLS